ncbi:MAG: histidine--tRNA ligase [Patescibacteria group bacterium]|nr:histidine--tRNA ligase [Patescibacteria group bacterium]MBU1952902.1 histidine--tRNA ligase [Patescibacteria group bacterium]
MNNKNLIKPSILPGFMELMPNEQLVFNSMLRTIQESYELFGFVPLDTPIIERAEVLLAKAGSEATKQTYRFKKGDTDQALRFDLTVPLARYVSQHFRDLIFPFRRYQIGKVYRGEKPQKGRFREFYQCDVDIIGKGNLDFVNDAEILAVTYFTFNRLGIGKFCIKLNNRKILSGFIEDLGIKEQVADVMRLIDKLEKVGKEVFIKELKNLNINSDQVEVLTNLLTIHEDASSTIKRLRELKIENNMFKDGVNELEEVVQYIKYLDIPETNWKIDLSVARGLDYYTGTVYETVLVDYPELGAVCSGGRYDNLAEYYTEEKLPGVGISLGLTRLFYQLNELNLIDKHSLTPTKVLLLPLTESLSETFGIATQLRLRSIPTEVYAHQASLTKKLEYSNKLGVEYAGIIGEKELKESSITLKNMKTGEQSNIKQKDLVTFLKTKLG